MPEEAVKPGMRLALRIHEIGSKSPYQLFFAGKGKSGASFGFMQADLAAGRAEVRQTFRDILSAAQVDPTTIGNLTNRLSTHLIGNPLSNDETRLVNSALDGQRQRVDALDELILTDVYKGVDACIATAKAAERIIFPAAQIYMALWINMTGPPTRLLSWLRGEPTVLRSAVAQPGKEVNSEQVLNYLQATDYYSENPQNLGHLRSAAEAGAIIIHDTQTSATATTSGASDTPSETHFTYEQTTGRLFLTEEDSNDLIATGYSGSEEGNGKNNPLAEAIHDVGPIPRGIYTIGEPRPGNRPTPITLPLTPDSGNNMFGRDAFLIHGDSIAKPGTASHGCIIMSRPDRERIAASKIPTLHVVARLA